MGIKIRLDGKEVEVIDYSVEEDSTPLTAGDSSGGVGSISITIPPIDADMPLRPGSRLAKVATFGPAILKGMPVELVDDRRGGTIGDVVDARRTNAGFQLTCETRLQSLSIYSVQTQPFAGTLEGAFQYYLGVAGADVDVVIEDPSLASRIVAYQGWSGELWYNLKQMSIAQGAEIALVGNTILMRLVRKNSATLSRVTDSSVSLGTGNLAQSIEIYQYNNVQIVNKLVWPAGSLGEESQIFSVNAGETVEFAITFSASLTSVVQPVAVDWVAPYESSASVYSILASNGQRITADAWSLNGGKLQVILNEDTKSARLIIRGPRVLAVPDPSSDDNELRAVTTFYIADFADGQQGDAARRSSLRILGTGVAFTKEKLTIPTGVAAGKTENKVGVTIDNPYISGAEEAYRAGSRAAVQYSGLAPTISAQLPASPLKNPAIPAFGNVAGSRVYDKETHRWYRIRSATYSTDSISVEADNDLLVADAQAHYGSRTYAEVETIFSGMTYEEVALVGLYG